MAAEDFRALSSPSRREFVALAASAAAAFYPGALWAALESGEPAVPVTGNPVEGLGEFDTLMAELVRENDVPGAALAIAWHDRLVYARGFGYADKEAEEPVEPGALFRIASISKPITAVAILQLVEQGKLGLDDKVMERMEVEPELPAGKEMDPRWNDITVRHCLQHTGGWDRGVSYDPIARPWRIARALRKAPPVLPVDVVRYMMRQPLDHNPGERYAYSNLGYLVLGRIIEAVTGESYEPYVKQRVLAPLGIKSMQLGKARIENRAPREVKYYDAQNRFEPSVTPPDLGSRVPRQYGGANLEGYEAHGGWIASAVDLVRFATAFDDPAKSPLLSKESIELMWSAPPGSVGHDDKGRPRKAYYGCGWKVDHNGGGSTPTIQHGGLIMGSETTLVRRCDGVTWCVLFNTNHPKGEPLLPALNKRMDKGIEEVSDWPERDLFGELLV